MSARASQRVELGAQGRVRLGQRPAPDLARPARTNVTLDELHADRAAAPPTATAIAARCHHFEHHARGRSYSQESWSPGSSPPRSAGADDVIQRLGVVASLDRRDPGLGSARPHGSKRVFQFTINANVVDPGWRTS